MSHDFNDYFIVGFLVATSPFWLPFWLLGWAALNIWELLK